MEVILINTDITLPIPELSGGVALNLQASLSAPLEIAPGETAIISSGISIAIADVTLQGQITPLVFGKPHLRGLVIDPENSILPSAQDTEIFVTVRNINATEYVKVMPLETFASLVFTPVTQPVLAAVLSYTP
jgi:dUTP pyrophosphatase